MTKPINFQGSKPATRSRKADVLGQYLGGRARSISADGSARGDRIRQLVDKAFLDRLADLIAGKLGGKVGLAPRIFLKKLVADILDRMDQFPDPGSRTFRIQGISRGCFMGGMDCRSGNRRSRWVRLRPQVVYVGSDTARLVRAKRLGHRQVWPVGSA